MEENYVYDGDYYYKTSMENGKEYRHFIFDFNKDMDFQLKFIHKHLINKMSISRADESTVSQIVDFIIKNQIIIYGLYLHNLTLDNIDFLSKLKTIEDLSIIVEINKRFNFNELPLLKRLNLFIGKYFKVEDININVISLKLHKVNIKSSTEFNKFKNIEFLDISQSSLTEINGLQELEGIKCLSLGYFPKLDSIKPIKKLKNLDTIKLQNCKSIADWDEIGEIKSLKKIGIENCGTIPDLNFLKGKNIEFISIVNTRIENGQIDWLFNKSIKYINLPVYKHYNIKPEDLWEYQRKIGMR